MFANTRKLLVPLATMAVAGIVTVGSGADWSTQVPTTTNVVAGDLLIQNDAGGTTLNLSNLKPGDDRTGSITITNAGTIDVDVELSETVTTPSTFSMLDLNVPATPADPTDDVSTVQIVIEQDGSPVYSGDLGGFAADGPYAAAAALPSDAGTGTTPADETTFTFEVLMSPDAPMSDQAGVAASDFNFNITPHTDNSAIPFTS